MIIHRWQAPLTPTLAQIQMILMEEGLEPMMEQLLPSQKISEHRHPHHEVRVVLEGELLFNVAGNQVLLRPGDRIEVPANTRHFHQAQPQIGCVSVVANRLG